ncbi:MarR family winged helix-turn-helix transcriptional regulator [Asticcacaulis solisilvae]|uniref:MarR family winged helix-turn-helix transcriptional regulator n=1 Tax=Asticcacaulis solisilvae TaxID=1217274 RepID=UPI003FD86133
MHRDLSAAIITFHETVARALGMSAPERKTLGVLADMGVVTAGQLASATGLTTGAITGIVDRLEKQGYARRVPNPNDRRSVLIHAQQVEKIREIQGPIFASLTAAMDDLLGHYSAEQRALIMGYLDGTTRVLREQTKKLKP